MKIAVSSGGPGLDDRVADTFGRSPYVIFLDPETMAFEAVPNPGAAGGQGSGVQAVVLMVSHEATVVLTGQCSPTARAHLSSAGIEVRDGLSGTVRRVVEEYRQQAGQTIAPPRQARAAGRASFTSASRQSIRQFVGLLPILLGVILAIGLFNALVSKEALASVFSGNSALDTLWGAMFGSLLAGNPINSYVIGNKLLDYDVSLYAVTALIIAWVTVGLLQLPAEIAALGRRFALVRNGLSFASAVAIALLAVVILKFID